MSKMYDVGKQYGRTVFVEEDDLCHDDLKNVDRKRVKSLLRFLDEQQVKQDIYNKFFVCPNCGNILSKNGDCDFCGEDVPHEYRMKVEHRIDDLYQILGLDK